MAPGPIWQPPMRPYSQSPVPAGPVSVATALDAIFRDPNRNHNLLCGFLLMIIPILGPIVSAGWYSEFHQRLCRAHPAPLPKFDFADFSHYLGRGVAPFVVQLILVLPVVFVSYLVMFAVAVGATTMTSVFHSTLFPVLIQLSFGLGFTILMLFVSVVLNAGLTRAELTGDIAKALQLGPLAGYVGATWATTLLKMLLFGCASMGLAVVGLLACCVGIYAVAAFLQLASVHLRWQVYNDYLTKGGEPFEIAPPATVPSEMRKRV